MTLLRRQNSQYIFQYSVPLETSGRPTRIVYRSPSAPYRVRGIRPTLMAVYKNASKVNSRRRQNTQRSSSPDRDPTPITSARQRSSTPPPSPIIPPTNPAHHVRSSSRARTPGPPFESASSTSRATSGGPPITRSASRPSTRNDAPSPSRTGTLAQSHKRPPPPSPTVSLWTRFGIKGDSPTFVRRDRTSSSTDRDCVTTYYESFSLDEIRTPPDLSDDQQLREGDVYINTVYDTGVPQMWIWSKDGGRVAFWKVAREGDVREDGRRLSITPKLGLPSWVKPDWCVRQMLKQQKAK